MAEVLRSYLKTFGSITDHVQQRQNAGVLHCVQDDGVKQATANASAVAS